MAAFAVSSAVSAPSSSTSAAFLSSKASASHVRVALAAPASRHSRRSLAVRASAVDLDELVASIKSLTLEQARTLTDRLQEELGVTAASFAPAAAAAAPGGGAAEAAPAAEEKTEFDLVLDEVPASARIAVIKVVRALTGLGLKEAKDMIEGLPKKVKEAVAKEDAEEGKKQLEGAGAKASIK